MPNIVLIGMPGTGKSTVGKLLACRRRCRFVDTDALLVRAHGKTLPQLIQSEGLEGFLRLEGELGRQLACRDCVIATGGSMVLSATAMQNLKNLGTVVWLDTPLAQLRLRIEKSGDRGIAAAPGTTLAEIDAVRRPLYEQYADVRIPCDK